MISAYLVRTSEHGLFWTENTPIPQRFHGYVMSFDWEMTLPIEKEYFEGLKCR